MSDIFWSALTGLLFIGAIALGLAQIGIGYAGIEYYWGTFAAVTICAVCLLLRFMLPITIFCYFGCVKVLHLEWYWALLITAPGLVFAVPTLLVSLIPGRR